ncbi:MAG: hypothetical protein QM692_07490 [Thermomicrobiales bacterium]
MTDPELKKAALAPPPGRLKRIMEPSLGGDGLALFRRSYRWLNLTLVQHGVWPLLVVIASAPVVPVGLTPLPWYWARLAAPLIAAILAVAYLSQQPGSVGSDRAARTALARSERDRMAREQVVILIVGVATAVSLLRLVQGPIEAVALLEAFGLADVAAYQLINFGLGARIVLSGARWLPVVLFGLSWGLHDLFLAAISPVTLAALPFIFAGGATLGLFIGALSWGLRRWPGGYFAAAAAHYLLVYLIAGYLT